mgnify:FL=1
MKLLASLLTVAALAAPALPAFAQAAAKPDLVKGEASYAAVCAACHGADGNSMIPNQPSLAQQHPEYLAKQLMEFKSGKRVDPVMSGMAAVLTDEDVVNVSAWLSKQKAAENTAKDKDLVALGERIYRGGLQDRQIAACAGCHSPNGVGIPAQYPRLSGQHADYTVAQLVNFREGKCTNSTQMTGVAAKMTDREIKAVSDYIAGLR